ncbi:HTH-type transcriptional repressor PurR [Paraburkholderia ultramafica]|uniref:HTH-type transcriptional repressor PurR n=1 Tax=Paraburkholderia ultramafica TaxID=1544867 RepID=A0A6S7BR19_9BURK|nr:LacI family DNA-binding transcriptional regulator [Paraburkholderia ultramafica]CAB3808685.1 HTH-type transcriptional repressor PurR [Paraburkholderia ultramafica]
MGTAGKPKITIHDIARISGASASTVSAALSENWRKRRIGEATAAKIRKIAAENGYTPNLQARGLRSARSGLIGLILPFHDNRFFSSLSQAFEAEARQRGWCPVIASTLRDPAEEVRIVETLISYAVDYLFIAGATNPDALGELCRAAKLSHLYVDLPGKDAPSVVSNNYHGARTLTERILAGMPRDMDCARSRPYFIGGLPTDYASAQRMRAFGETLEAAGIPFEECQIIPSGYSPGGASREIAILCERLGGLPAGLFVNSIRPFEGVVSHLLNLPPESFADSVIGCYDYDPFASFLQFPVHMMRQNSNELIASAFKLVDAGTQDSILIQVEPELIPPRTTYGEPFSELG